MPLEQNIERIADALEALVAKTGTAVDLPEAALETAKPTTAPIVNQNHPALGGKAEGPAKTANNQPPANTDLDEEDLTWDKRIHSGSKTKLVNGNWKKLRGVSAALVATVEAEIRAALQTGASSIPDSSIPQGVITMTLADLQIAAQDVVRQLGPRLNEVAAVLQKYGASELSGLAAEHYTNFLAEIQALLTPPA